MIKKMKYSINNNKKNIFKISSGTLIGQILSIVTLPIITRIYGAEIIGIWTLLNSIALLVKSFSDLGMTNSVMIIEEEILEINYRVITTIVAIISILSSIIIIIYYIISKKNLQLGTGFTLLFLIFIIFTTQQIQICYALLNRESKYNILMKNPIIKNGVFGVFSIILGVIGFKKYGYFLAYIIASIITLYHMKRNLPSKLFSYNLEEYKIVFKRNKKFIMYQLPNNIISNFKNQLPIFLIETLWGAQILGYYSITVKLLQMPSSLLASAIGRVFFQTTSKMKREGKDIGEYVYKNITMGMKLSIFPVLIFMVFGDIIAVIFLGSDWKIAGDFIRILALQYFFMFIMNTVQGLTVTLEKQGIAVICNVLQAIVYILGAITGKYMFDNIYYGLAFMSIGFIVINIGYFIALFKVMNVSIRKYITHIIINLSVIITLTFIIRLMLKNIINKYL